MGGNRQPGAWGASADEAGIDAGTSARVGMPPPASTGTARLESFSTASSSLAGAPLSGGIPYAVGQSSVVRIPIPGTNGLCIELTPRGWVPKGGSTSTLFFQDASGKRHLRLDYGYNVKTKTIDYHWNQKGTAAEFGVADHTPAGTAGKTVHTAAKYFRYAGRVLVVAGVVVDAVSIVQASRPIRRASQVVTAWAGAWVGCQLMGEGGAAIGTLASPIGTAIGGIGGCIVGGIGGYYGGSALGGDVYDWAENTFFTPLPQADPP